MTESEWLASGDPRAMLAWLTDPGDRKLRLFALAAGCPDCVRLGTVFGPRHYAEYVAGASCRSRAEKAALLREIFGDPFRPATLREGGLAVDWSDTKGESVRFVGSPDGERVQVIPDWLTPQALCLALAAYEERPGQPCGKCDGKGDTWNYRFGHKAICSHCNKGRVEGAVLDPFRLAILADALEEARCDGDVILSHLRSPGPHVRGCWALDLILGEE